MAVLIASGTTQADSVDFSVVAGTPVTLALFSATDETLPTDASAAVQFKSSAGTYFTIGELSRVESAKVLDGPGTYRVRKRSSASAIGVDKV